MGRAARLLTSGPREVGEWGVPGSTWGSSGGAIRAELPGCPRQPLQQLPVVRDCITAGTFSSLASDELPLADSMIDNSQHRASFLPVAYLS